MFYICSIVVIFRLQMWKGAKVKTRKLTHDEIRRKLIEPFVMNETIESDELTNKIHEVEDLVEKAALYEQGRKA